MYNKCRQSSCDGLIHSSSQGMGEYTGEQSEQVLAHLHRLNEAGEARCTAHGRKTGQFGLMNTPPAQCSVTYSKSALQTAGRLPTVLTLQHTSII